MGKVRLGLLTALFGVGMVIFAGATAVLLLTWPEPASRSRSGKKQEKGPSASRTNARGDVQFVSGEEFGRWRVFEGGSDELPEDHSQSIEELEKIGYLGGTVEAGEDNGITILDESKAYEGLNFYVSGHGPEAVLIDMEGRELHRWRAAYDDAVAADPSADTQAIRLSRPDEDREFWRRAALLPDGDVIAIFEGSMLLRVDRDSNILWSRVNRSHHDLHIHDDGTIFVLTRKAGLDPDINADAPVLKDFVTLISPQGEEVRSIRVWEAFENSMHALHLHDSDRRGDLLHTNTLEVLDGSQEHRSSAFKEGNILLSMRVLSLIAILDPESEEIVWTLKGMWLKQHQPTLLANGNMLIFDNLGGSTKERKYSRILEFNPLTQQVAWSYAGSSETPFFSEFCGSNQRLPNGNTLITETDNGRAFEVTADGEIVWEFVNPARAGENHELIASVFELIRYDGDYATFLTEEK